MHAALHAWQRRCSPDNVHVWTCRAMGGAGCACSASRPAAHLPAQHAAALGVFASCSPHHLQPCDTALARHHSICFPRNINGQRLRACKPSTAQQGQRTEAVGEDGDQLALAHHLIVHGPHAAEEWVTVHGGRKAYCRSTAAIHRGPRRTAGRTPCGGKAAGDSRVADLAGGALHQGVVKGGRPADVLQPGAAGQWDGLGQQWGWKARLHFSCWQPLQW